MIGPDTELRARLADARSETDALFDRIRPDCFYERPIPERHRLIFYLGHLEAFDWNLLQPRLAGLKSRDASLDQLFAFGIDPLDGQAPADRKEDWPTVAEVSSYVGRMRARLDNALAESSFEDSSLLLNVAVEHRLMHAETLSYMMHQMPLDQKRNGGQPAAPESPLPQAEMIEIPEGIASLGLSRGISGEFGWDNEFEATAATVPAFEIDRYKVTNGEYLKFVEAGGYGDPSYWSEEDLAWKAKHDISHPIFWTPEGKGWRYRGMFEEIPLPRNWPVYVSHAEASAYAKWAGKKLPTEEQWQRAAYGETSCPFPWGAALPDARHGYLGLKRWDPAPVNAFPEARGEMGLDGLLGNGWEWTSSTFQPFPGFEPFSFYQNYSAGFFDHKHYVMKGGSMRTERHMLRRSFRNWFQPHYQYVYAGFRCAND